jgi:acyl carrier protein
LVIGMKTQKVPFLTVLRDVLARRTSPLRLIPTDNSELSEMQVSDLELDSVETLELLLAFEDAFEVRVDERAFIDCQYIKNFADILDTSTRQS